MAIFYTHDLKPHDIPHGRLLGMDLGTKTIGLAVCNTTHCLVTPLTTIKRTKFTHDLQAFKSVIRDYEITGYVMGWPINMDGTRSAGCDRTQSFADEMHRNAGIFGINPWVLFYDERLSTVLVDHMVDNSADKSKAKKKGQIDALAAQIILQDALNFIQKLPFHNT